MPAAPAKDGAGRGRSRLYSTHDLPARVGLPSPRAARPFDALPQAMRRSAPVRASDGRSALARG